MSEDVIAFEKNSSKVDSSAPSSQNSSLENHEVSKQEDPEVLKISTCIPRPCVHQDCEYIAKNEEDLKAHLESSCSLENIKQMWIQKETELSKLYKKKEKEKKKKKISQSFILF